MNGKNINKIAPKKQVVKDYVLVAAAYSDNFSQRVNELLKMGYTFRGHVRGGFSKGFFQAMVKYEDV